MQRSNDLPPFVERGGELVIRHPLMLEKAFFRGFLLEGDRAKLQAMCDKVFNAPSQGALDFRPLSQIVLLSFTTIPRAYSTHAQDRHFGWVEEIDVAFWVPLLSRRHGKLHLSWYIPYIFVDNSFALATGREIYGFPKTMGRFTIPDSPDSLETYSVETLAWDRYSPQTKAQQQRVVEVIPRQDVYAGSRFETALDTIWQALALFTQGDGLGARLEIARAEMDNLIIGRQAPIVFLRQLRDIRNPDRATAEELGLSAEGQPAKAAFWAHFDFLMDSGETLWRVGGEPTHSSGVAIQRQEIGHERAVAFATALR